MALIHSDRFTLDARGHEVDVVDAVDLLCSSDSSGLDYGEGASTPRSSVIMNVFSSDSEPEPEVRFPSVSSSSAWPRRAEFFSVAAPR